VDTFFATSLAKSDTTFSLLPWLLCNLRSRV